MENLANAVIQGVMVGGLYAMFAIGLALIFGVMKLVNIAHGDLIVLAAYIGLVVTQTLGINPLAALVVVIPLMAVVGYALQRGLFNRTMGGDLMPPLLVSFGLSVIMQNGFLALFSADNKRLHAGALEVASVRFSRRDQHRRAAAAATRAGDPGHRGVCNSLLYRTRSAARSAPSATIRDRAIDGAQQPPCVRPGDGAVARHCRRSPACCWRSAPISIPPPGRRG